MLTTSTCYCATSSSSLRCEHSCQSGPHCSSVTPQGEDESRRSSHCQQHEEQQMALFLPVLVLIFPEHPERQMALPPWQDVEATSSAVAGSVAASGPGPLCAAQRQMQSRWDNGHAVS